MKNFNIVSKSHNSRLGQINLSKKRHIITPNFFFPTDHLVVPYLTNDLLDEITNKENIILLNFFEIQDVCTKQFLDDFAAKKDLAKEKKSALKTFLGFSNYPVCVTFENHKLQLFNKNFVGISRSCKSRVTREDLLSLSKTYGVDMIIDPFYQNDFLKKDEKLKKKYLDEKKVDGKKQSHKEVVVSYYGGIRDLCEKKNFGVQVKNFGRVSLDTQIRSIVSFLGDVKSEEMVMMYPMMSPNPHEVLELIGVGIDIVKGDYPFKMAKLGFALIFPINPKGKFEQKMKVNIYSTSCKFDFSPVMKDCKCQCCSNHTKAYIHHLLKCNELLGFILLTIHNASHYVNFFRSIREAIKNNNFESYKKDFFDSTNKNG